MEINNYIFFSIAGLAYLIVLMCVFFAKKRFKLLENNIYMLLIFCTLIGIINELIMVYCVPVLETSTILKECVSKLFLLITEFWAFLLCAYTVIVTNNMLEKKTYGSKKEITLLCIIYIICAGLTCALPIEYAYNVNGTSWLYTYGLSTKMVFVTGILFITICIFYIFKNKENIKIKKYIPVYVYIVLSIIASLVQQIDPNILIISFMETLIVSVMYFTIENPDLQLLREFHKAREYANNLNTEKSEFLFNMAGEIKTPISVINRISKEVLMQDDINVIKSKVNDIKYSSNNLLELVNKVLDINSLEKRKVSVRESKYNTTNLFKGIESQTELKLNNDLVKFRTNYDKSIPNELYGDSVRIRQIVNTLLENAIKYTKEGFIELSVNSIVKHDICRLVITVEDSGVGMTQDVVEHLFDKELDKIEEIDNPKMDLGLVKTLLDLIGGTIIVNSELNHGTKFTIVLDQKVVNHKKNKTIEAVEKYEEMYLNNKKVMCVINDDTLSKKVNTLFKKYQLDIEIVKLGQSCLEKVRALEKFDLIIIEEHLEKLSSENTLAKLKSIQGFKTPVILLTDIKDINEKEEYLKLGFTEIVTLPLKKEQVEELVNNYVQEK